MKKRLTAWLLVLALGCSLLATAAFAGEKAADAVPTEEQTEVAAETRADPAEETSQTAQTTGEATAPVPEEGIVTGGYNPELSVLQPDPAGRISFANVESRMREGNLQILALQGNIDTIEDIDYDKMYEDLREQLNEIASQQWGLVMAPAEFVGGEYEKGKAYDQLDQAYDAVREKFDAIKEGEMQKDNADLARQLKNLQDQIVVAGEHIYRPAGSGGAGGTAAAAADGPEPHRGGDGAALSNGPGVCPAAAADQDRPDPAGQRSGDPADECPQPQDAAGAADRR